MSLNSQHEKTQNPSEHLRGCMCHSDSCCASLACQCWAAGRLCSNACHSSQATSHSMCQNRNGVANNCFCNSLSKCSHRDTCSCRALGIPCISCHTMQDSCCTNKTIQYPHLHNNGHSPGPSPRKILRKDTSSSINRSFCSCNFYAHCSTCRCSCRISQVPCSPQCSCKPTSCRNKVNFVSLIHLEYLGLFKL